MALRYTCDGCDADLPATPGIDQQTVTIELRSGGARLLSELRHLCARCLQHLPDKADPKQWPRAVAAREEAPPWRRARRPGHDT